MENEYTEYKDDNEESFIEYVFFNDVKEKGTIKLELTNTESGKPLNKHIYEQLLQIFVEGLKCKYGENDKVDISKLEIEDILLIKEYFLSFNVDLIFNMYTKENYVFKPYIYGNKFLEDKHKKLDDYFYEVQVEKDKNILFYRISFNLI